MADAIRHVVSQKKKRFVKDGFDLDLTYITDHIIAMGFPSASVEGVYRNNIKDVVKFFHHYHPKHFKIYNLCSEREYDAAEFDGRAVRYPFDDHNPSPFELIYKFCEDASMFLEEDSKNVVAVHCKAGKGRTGMMVSCLLLYLKKVKTAKQALDFFGETRTSNNKGVTIPSQQRYVQYFHTYLTNYLFVDRPFPAPALTPLRITKITMSPPPNFDVGGGCDPHFAISNMEHTKIYVSKNHHPISHWQSEATWSLDLKIPVVGDVLVTFYDQDATSKDDKMFGFWFNTAFVDSGGLKFQKQDLDKACKDTDHHVFDAKFTVTVQTQDMSPDEYAKLSIEEKQEGHKKAGKGVLNKVRSLVSQKKIRFQEEGFDLDLTYITDKIIAMGFPSSKVEGLFRNHMKDVQKFFQKYHEKNFKVFNLCVERTYDNKSFDGAGGEFSHYPFADHNPCPFNMIPKFCHDAVQFLSKGDAKTVAIHCKAGKGRTGLMTSCLLMALGIYTTADEAIEHFALTRTANKKGITIPSQMRYVRYFQTYLSRMGNHFSEADEPPRIPDQACTIKHITLSGAPDFDAGGGCDPYFTVTRVRDGCELWNSKKTDKKRPHWNRDEPRREFACEVPVQGDIKITFYDHDKVGGDDKMFSFWLNTSFLRGKKLVLAKSELDSANKDKKHKKFPPNFSCALHYEPLTHGDYKRIAKPMQTRGSISKVVKRDKGHKGANKLRALVSKKKLRFQQDGFDLDLSYVGDRIIAMGFPSEGAEEVYRNPMKEVKRFFQRYHDKHFKVYNLCSERKYDPSKFTSIGGQCAHFPFDDHNPCAFSVIPKFCKDVGDWLAADRANIAAIHCKAGKGRTGLMISCLLMYLKEAPTADAALEYYGNARTANKKGVTIPSQGRYVHYFENYLKNYVSVGKPFPYDDVKVTLTGFSMNLPPNFDVGGGCDPYFKIHNMQGDLIYNMAKDKNVKIPSYRQGELKLPCQVELQGDIKVTFFDHDKVGKDEKMFMFWINTACLDSNQLHFTKVDLDKAVKDKKCEHFDNKFRLTAYFHGVAGRSDDDPPPPPPDYPDTDDLEDEDEVDEDGAPPPPPGEDDDEDPSITPMPSSPMPSSPMPSSPMPSTPVPPSPSKAPPPPPTKPFDDSSDDEEEADVGPALDDDDDDGDDDDEEEDEAEHKRASNNLNISGSSRNLMGSLLEKSPRSQSRPSSSKLLDVPGGSPHPSTPSRGGLGDVLERSGRDSQDSEDEAAPPPKASPRALYPSPSKLVAGVKSEDEDDEVPPPPGSDPPEEPPEEPTPDITLKGTMKKKAPALGIWQVRYFSLDSKKGVLLYWKTKTDGETGAAPQGTISLRAINAVEIVDSERASFDINTSQDRVYHLQAKEDGQPDAKAWVKALNQCITGAKQGLWHGVLKKRSPKVIGGVQVGKFVWQRRYFMLDEKTRSIKYWGRQEDSQGQPLGIIEVRGIKSCHLDESGRNRFIIIMKTGDRQPYSLEAPSSWLVRQWVARINAIKAEIEE